uniref:Uncharacterized protein n=1 Tax=Anguilla anguilla TaxID=7936 RepID=A0A0E9SWL5_ANGAN
MRMNQQNQATCVTQCINTVYRQNNSLQFYNTKEYSV